MWDSQKSDFWTLISSLSFYSSRTGDGGDGGGATVAPEMTRKFFESILRTADDNPGLLVNKVLVRQMEDLKRHFCSGKRSLRSDINHPLTCFECREIEIRPELLKMEIVAEIHAVDVFGSDSLSSSQQPVEYHLIVKSHPQNEDAQRFLQPGHTFDKEVGMYGQVS